MEDNAYKKIPDKNRCLLLDGGLDVAKDEGYELSALNLETIKCLDSIGLKLHGKLKKLSKNPNFDQIVTGASLQYASVIIESLEHLTGKKGKWYYHHKTIGENTFPYVIDNTVLFPVQWFSKRVLDGKKSSILDKFTIFLKEINARTNTSQ